MLVLVVVSRWLYSACPFRDRDPRVVDMGCVWRVAHSGGKSDPAYLMSVYQRTDPLADKTRDNMSNDVMGILVVRPEQRARQTWKRGRLWYVAERSSVVGPLSPLRSSRPL